MAKRAVKIADPTPVADVAAIDGHTMPLPETMDLAAASGLAKTLLAARGSDLTIDASAVKHLGAQCAQVLVSAVLTWQNDQADLRIVEHSAEFEAALRLLGLTSALEIKEVC